MKQRVVAVTVVLLMIGTLIIGFVGCGGDEKTEDEGGEHLYSDGLVQCVLPVGWSGNKDGDVTSLMDEESMDTGIVLCVVEDVIETDLETASSTFAIMQAESADMDWVNISEPSYIRFGNKRYLKYETDSYDNGTHFYHFWLYTQDKNDLCSAQVMSKSNRINDDVKNIMKSMVFLNK